MLICHFYTNKIYMPLFVHPQEKYEEKFVVGDESFRKMDAPAQTVQGEPEVTPQEVTNKGGSQTKTGSNGMIIRGMTFYKSEPDPMVADDGEPGENCKYKPFSTNIQTSQTIQTFFHKFTNQALSQ